MSVELVKLDAVKQFLQQATDLSALLDIQAKVDAGLLYARRSSLHDAQNELAEAKIRIDRRIGQLLTEMPKSKGSQGNIQNHLSGGSTLEPPEKTKTFADLGIAKTTAHRLQQEASVPDEEFEAYVAESKQKGQEITTTGVLKLAQKQKQHRPVETPQPIPEGEYSVVYADPPWRYDFAPAISREIESHYSTMDLEAICKMTLPTISKDAVLFMWATAPKLVEAIKVMESWGFDYKTCALWDKERIGMGYWFRGEHELLFVGTRGNMSPPVQEVRVSSIFRERRTEHSKKPDYFYELIETYFPNLPKIELFARNTRQGWASYGNQVNDKRESLSD